MGFFDKKRRDDETDEEPPVTEVLPPLRKSMSPPPPPPPTPTPEARMAPPPPPPPTLPPVIAMPPEPAFTIDEAIQLMRQLPNRNVELVMQVVKKTLESVRVDVARIIEGATKKEQVIEERIAGLRKDIEKLEGQIATARKEIAGLEAEQKEVSLVKERLAIAQKTEAEAASIPHGPTDRALSRPPPPPAPVATPIATTLAPPKP